MAMFYEQLCFLRLIVMPHSMIYEPCYTSDYSHSEREFPPAANAYSSKTKKSHRRSKHIPHYLRPVDLVEKRNTRERRRVQDVNQAFHRLQSLLPSQTHDETSEPPNLPTRLSKVRTLRKAVDYIVALQHLLEQLY